MRSFRNIMQTQLLNSSGCIKISSHYFFKKCINMRKHGLCRKEYMQMFEIVSGAFEKTKLVDTRTLASSRTCDFLSDRSYKVARLSTTLWPSCRAAHAQAESEPLDPKPMLSHGRSGPSPGRTCHGDRLSKLRSAIPHCLRLSVCPVAYVSFPLMGPTVCPSLCYSYPRPS